VLIIMQLCSQSKWTSLLLSFFSSSKFSTPNSKQGLSSNFGVVVRLLQQTRRKLWDASVSYIFSGRSWSMSDTHIKQIWDPNPTNLRSAQPMESGIERYKMYMGCTALAASRSPCTFFTCASVSMCLKHRPGGTNQTSNLYLFL
jgi:hypothetical protein